MAFKKVAALDADTTVALGGKNAKTGKSNPTTVTGYYIGKRTVETEFGPGLVHFLQTPTGNIGVWGKTNMNVQLEQVTPGALTRITFIKMQKIPGRKDMYKYDVEVDPDRSIPVNAASNEDEGAEPTSAYEDQDVNAEFDPDDASLDETDLDGEPALDEVPVSRAVPPRRLSPTPDAARQAKVKALLSKSARA